MHFYVLIALQVLLVCGFEFAGAQDITGAQIKAFMCSEEASEMREGVMKCVESVDMSEYKDIVQPCNEAVDMMDPEAGLNYACEATEDELTEVHSCVKKALEDSGKIDEIREKVKPMEECMIELFGGGERK